MSSYIPNVTDYIPEIQPFKPDLNFMGNVLQAKQSKYDVAKKQISSIYGTMLNSPLSRDTNVKKREEFFNAIDGQIQQISGLDLSLQQNQEFASNVFNGLSDDKNIKKDMIWSKNFENELQRAEGFKLCVDPTKCNGKYWDGGIEEMQYRKQEFKNMSDEEALTYGDVSFTPAQDVTGKTLAFIKDNKLEIKHDSIRGGYKVTTKNGKDATPYFQSLLMSTFATDPAMTAYYKSQSFIERKRTTGGDPANEALYIQRKMNEASNTNTKSKTKLTTEVDTNDVLLNAFIEELREQGMDATDKQLIENFKEQYGANEAMKTHLAVYDEQGKLIENTELNSSNLRIAGANIDAINGMNKLQNELGKIANDYAMATFEQTMEADPFAVASYKAQLDAQADAAKNGWVDKNDDYHPGTSQRGKLWELQVGITGGNGKANQFKQAMSSINTITNADLNLGEQNTTVGSSTDAGTNSDADQKRLAELKNAATATTDAVTQAKNNIETSKIEVITNLTNILTNLKTQDSTKNREISALSTSIFGFDVTADKSKNAVKEILNVKGGRNQNEWMTKINTIINPNSPALVGLGLTNSLHIMNAVGTSLSKYKNNVEQFNNVSKETQTKAIAVVNELKASYKIIDEETAPYQHIALNYMTKDSFGIPNITKNKETAIREIATKLHNNDITSNKYDVYYKSSGAIPLGYFNEATEIYNKVAADVLDKVPKITPFGSPSLGGGGTSGTLSAAYPMTISNDSENTGNVLAFKEMITNTTLVEDGDLNRPAGKESSEFAQKAMALLKQKINSGIENGELKIPEFTPLFTGNSKQNDAMVGLQITLPMNTFTNNELKLLTDEDSELASSLAEGEYTFTLSIPKDKIPNNQLVQASKRDFSTWANQTYGSTFTGMAGSSIITKPNGEKVKVIQSLMQDDGEIKTSSVDYNNLKEYNAINGDPNFWINKHDEELLLRRNLTKQSNKNGNQ